MCPQFALDLVVRLALKLVRLHAAPAAPDRELESGLAAGEERRRGNRMLSRCRLGLVAVEQVGRRQQCDGDERCRLDARRACGRCAVRAGVVRGQHAGCVQVQRRNELPNVWRVVV